MHWIAVKAADHPQPQTFRWHTLQRLQQNMQALLRNDRTHVPQRDGRLWRKVFMSVDNTLPIAHQRQKINAVRNHPQRKLREGCPEKFSHIFRGSDTFYRPLQQSLGQLVSL